MVGNSNLESHLLENWNSWAAGGITADAIEKRALKFDRTELIRVISQGSEIPEMEDLSIKILLDVATWLTHGVHSLLYYPREIRSLRISETAKSIGVSETFLQTLYRSFRPPGELK